MILGESLQTIFFNLINFALVVACFVVMYKKYVHPAITARMLEKQQQTDDLHARAQQAEQHAAQVQGLLEEQQRAQDRMRQHVAQWRAVIQQKQAERSAQQQKRQQMIDQKERTKKDALEQLYLRRQIGPQALRSVHDYVQKKYAQIDNERHYSAAILRYMRKSAS